MRKKFSFLFLCLCLLPLPYGAAEEWSDTSFFASYFQVGIDTASHPGLYGEVGQKELVAFDPISSEENGDEVTYESSITLSFRMNLFTTYLPAELLESYYTQSEQTIPWLDLWIGDDVQLIGYAFSGQLFQYALGYSDYDLSGTPIATVGNFGAVDLDFSIANFHPNQLSFQNDVFTFEPDILEASLEHVRLDSVKYTTIGEYDDEFLGENSASFGVIDDVATEEAWYDPMMALLMGDAAYTGEDQLENYLSSNNVGIEQGPVLETVIKQKFANVMFDTNDPSHVNVYLRPEVSKYYQHIYGTYAEIVFDDTGSDSGIVYDKSGVYDKINDVDYPNVKTHTESISEYRDIGVHVSNLCAYMDFEICYHFTTTGKMSYSTLSDGSALDLPQVVIDDMFWDLFLTGEESGEYYYDSGTWWTEWYAAHEGQIKLILGIAIAGVLIYLFWPMMLQGAMRNRKKF